MNVLAVDIGGTHFRTALVDRDGAIIRQSKYKTPRQQGAAGLRPLLLKAIEELLSKGDQQDSLAAIGIGFGGPVDFAQQRVLRSMHAPGWVEFSFGQWLKPIFSVPVVVENDGNAGAWGEYSYGVGRGTKSFVYYTVSTGVGGGIVLDGKLYRGRRSAAGELGHMPLALEGPKCSCGQQGCVEALCSGSALADRAQHVLRTIAPTENPLLRRFLEEHGNLTAEHVFAAAGQGDSLARALITDLQQWFGRAVVGVMQMLDPDCIAIGGGLGLAPGFTDAVADYVDSHRPLGHGPGAAVEAASLGDDSVLLGAATLAWDIDKQKRG